MGKIWTSMILLFILISCSNKQAESIEVVKLQPMNFQVLLFSNNQNMNVEKEYIDALLSLQRESASNQKMWEKEILDKNEIPEISIEDYPTIVILQKGNIIKKISGPLQKNEILSVINQIVNINET